MGWRPSAAAGARIAAATLGASGIVAQTVLLREILSQFAGNELYLGVIIGIWIAAEAGGGLLAGRFSPPARAPAVFVGFTLSFSLLFPLLIVLTRGCKLIARLPADQAAGLVQTAVTAAALLAPAAVLHGAQFVAAISLFVAAGGDRQGAAGSAYAYDTLGTIAGGLLASLLLLPLLSAMQSAALLLAAGGVAIFLLGRAFPGCSARLPATVALLAALLLLVGGDGPERFSQGLRWQGKELLVSGNSPYQQIAVIGTGEQRTVYTDGRPLVSFPFDDIEAAELLAHLPLLAHPAPQRVLLLGGGAGGVLPAVLQHAAVRRVDYLEPDPAMTATILRFADADSRRALADPRVTVLHRDGREFVRAGGRSYDVILLGTPLPENLQENRYVSLEFFRLLARRLADGGVVALLAPGATAYYGAESKQLTESLLATVTAAFPHTLVLPGERNLFLASSGLQLETLTPELLATRLRARGVTARSVNRQQLAWLFEPTQREWFRAAITAGGVINGDLQPYLLGRRLLQTTAMFNPGLKPLLQRFDGLSTGSLLPWLLLPAGGVLLLARRRPPLAILYLIATTGCGAMILELCLLLLFQLLHGALVQQLGLLTALFMAGIWGGSSLATTAGSVDRDRHRLLAGEAGLLAVAGSLALLCTLPGITTGLAAGAAYLLILPLLLLAGLFTGLQFPPAVRLLGWEQGRSAAAVYAGDLLGGCLGGAAAGLLLLPFLGFRTTLLLVLLLKAGSLLGLQFSATGGRMSP